MLRALRMMLTAMSLGMAAVPAHAAGETALDPGRLAAAQARLTGRLLAMLPGDGQTVAFSPASLAGVAAALDLGAGQRFRSAMHGALGFGQGDSAKDFAGLRAKLRALPPDGPLRAAGLVVVNRGVDLYPGIPLAFEQAGIGLQSKDFASPATVSEVNGWVKDHTAGLIPSIVDDIPSSATLLALNALHFKDRWKTPFDRAATRPLPFRPLRGAARPVPTMSLPEGRYAFRRDGRFMAIDLPFADGRSRLVVVTSAGDRPADARQLSAAAPWLGGTGFGEVAGDLQLPSFSLKEGRDLTASLDRLGLRSARLSAGSLTGFSPEPARLTRILQRVAMSVDEDGAEAAAATAALVERSIAGDFVRMKVDRPFLFALRDAPSGFILLAGYVGMPQSGGPAE